MKCSHLDRVYLIDLSGSICLVLDDEERQWAHHVEWCRKCGALRFLRAPPSEGQTGVWVDVPREPAPTPVRDSTLEVARFFGVKRWEGR